jgi:tRNA dimethylallyltransferase
MLKARDKIIVILGPTSSGKSEVAIKLAKKFSAKGGPAYGWNGAEIISADSRQVYRGMDIGTGKVPKSKCKSQNAKLQFKNEKYKVYCSQGVAHYLIDIVSPKTIYNAAKFKNDASYVINYLHAKGKLPIICGGTGFWIKAIVDDINFPEVKPNRELRKRLEKESAEKLFRMLQKLDPERAKNIDAKNKVRLIRAIEICKAIGKVPKIIKHGTWNMEHKFLQIGIDISKEQLHENIKKRLEKRFKAGIIKEVENLKKSGLSWKKIQSFGLGYYWIPLYLQGNLEKKELFEKVYQAEKDYAKRQMTWFKKDKRIIWLPVCRKGRKNYEEIMNTVNKFTS